MIESANTDLERVVAEAIQQADNTFGYHAELIGLVDGVHTWRLRLDGKELFFTDNDDETASEQYTGFIAKERSRVRAAAVLTALSGPQPPPEPVAWRYRWPNHEQKTWPNWSYSGDGETARIAADEDGQCEPLYPHPDPAMANLQAELQEAMELNAALTENFANAILRLRVAREVIAPLYDFHQFVDTNDADDEKYNFLLRAGAIRRAASFMKEMP